MILFTIQRYTVERKTELDLLVTKKKESTILLT